MSLLGDTGGGLARDRMRGRRGTIESIRLLGDTGLGGMPDIKSSWQGSETGSDPKIPSLDPVDLHQRRSRSRCHLRPWQAAELGGGPVGPGGDSDVVRDVQKPGAVRGEGGAHGAAVMLPEGGRRRSGAVRGEDGEKEAGSPSGPPRTAARRPPHRPLGCTAQSTSAPDDCSKRPRPASCHSVCGMGGIRDSYRGGVAPH